MHENRGGHGRRSSVALRAAWTLAAAVVAAALAWMALPRNIERACEADEWPHLSSCAKPTLVPTDQVQALRERASRNPGDATSYLALALLAVQPAGVPPLKSDAVLATAVQLAPQDPMLRRALASDALARRQWPQAVQWLILLIQVNHDSAAALQMARLLTVPDARGAVLAAVQPGSVWVAPVMTALGHARVPGQEALPFLSAALASGLIGPDQGLAMVSQLKSARRWLDAQGLWLKLLGQPSPLIYNGDFEQGFLRGGFDWELPDLPPYRSGVTVQQPMTEGTQGRALALSFNGRPLALPVIAQTLVLFPGVYQLNGRYMSRHLRAGNGLIWAFSCADGDAPLTHTGALADTVGRWQDFSLPVEVPATCGAVQMRLTTALKSDALAGLSGDLYFDNIRLKAP